jgi:hypothetical protein
LGFISKIIIPIYRSSQPYEPGNEDFLEEPKTSPKNLSKILIKDVVSRSKKKKKNEEPSDTRRLTRSGRQPTSKLQDQGSIHSNVQTSKSVAVLSSDLDADSQTESEDSDYR